VLARDAQRERPHAQHVHDRAARGPAKLARRPALGSVEALVGGGFVGQVGGDAEPALQARVAVVAGVRDGRQGREHGGRTEPAPHGAGRPAEIVIERRGGRRRLVERHGRAQQQREQEEGDRDVGHALEQAVDVEDHEPDEHRERLGRGPAT